MSISIRVVGIFAELKTTVGAYSVSNYINLNDANRTVAELYKTTAKITDLSYTDKSGNYITHVIFTFY